MPFHVRSCNPEEEVNMLNQRTVTVNEINRRTIRITLTWRYAARRSCCWTGIPGWLRLRRRILRSPYRTPPPCGNKSRFPMSVPIQQPNTRWLLINGFYRLMPIYVELERTHYNCNWHVNCMLPFLSHSFKPSNHETCIWSMLYRVYMAMVCYVNIV